MRRCCSALFVLVLTLPASAQTAIQSTTPASIPSASSSNLTPQIPQQIPPISDQKALLAATRHAYYLPLDRGVQGFTCSVAIDWQLILERATGQKLSPHEATVAKLLSANVSVTDDILKAPVVTVTFPQGEPAAGTPVRTKQDILNHMIAASLAGWNPFLSDRILPMEDTHYHFESAPGGYRLTLDGGNFFSILDLDRQLQIVHGETHLQGVVTTFTPTFDPSSHGWLLTSLATSSGSGESSSAPSSPDKAAFIYSYQFVGDMLVPKKITVQVADGPPTPFELRDCNLLKAGATAESKAAPAAKP